MGNIQPRDYSLTYFHHCLLPSYSFIQLAALGHRGDNENAEYSIRNASEDTSVFASIEMGQGDDLGKEHLSAVYHFEGTFMRGFTF